LPGLLNVCWDVPMSFWLHALPLHTLGSDGWDWAVTASVSHGLPEYKPKPRALPTAAQVMAAFTAAGCHGQAWFTMETPDASQGLPPCPNPGECARRGGLDLGEVTLTPAGSPPGRHHLASGTFVTAIGFRKPASQAVLAGLSALTPAAGPLLIFDDTADRLFVIHEHDQPDNLTHWPW
jgi:hypothetical protein